LCGGNPFEFSTIARKRPLELHQLLGRHISEVVPGVNWQSLPIPEEFMNLAIRYHAFGREDLAKYMTAWEFLTEDYCISSTSWFLLFFNRGFIFQVELRMMPDSYSGALGGRPPIFCGDETPVFKMLAKQLGGSVLPQGSSSVLIRQTDKYFMTLGTGDGKTDLIWRLRGGPSSPKF
jgi:hypothetical protein